ncbi:MAG: cyclophilin-like fold protein [Propionicimonas sp.]
MTRIRINTGSGDIEAELFDNTAARDLLAMLPLEVTIFDYGRQERSPTCPALWTRPGCPPAPTRTWATSATGRPTTGWSCTTPTWAPSPGSYGWAASSARWNRSPASPTTHQEG